MIIIDGIDVLVTVAVLAAILAAWQYASWHRRVEDRKMRRLVERNLRRGGLT